jgi:hypothetical protein
VISLCKDVYVDFHPHPGVLDLEHVAQTCAGDWGLYIDVMGNIDKVVDRLEDYDLSPRESSRIARTLELAQDMMTEHAKPLRWRLRARIGKRLRWYNEIEEQFPGRSDADIVRSGGGTGPARAGGGARTTGSGAGQAEGGGLDGSVP